jgi:hypothetical protein
MLVGGTGRDSELDLSAPGSAPVAEGSTHGGVVEVKLPLPIDTNPAPLPVNVPVHPWEHARPVARPGAPAWEELQAPLDEWQEAPQAPDGSDAVEDYPDGQA